ncbi:hypothetical protein ACF3DV_26395 [Chlorogloeopsis fritschii PCC 9212]|uniref:Uncharacterized protein n=1 Tax=Chlorogloeopsis fritschii PCC 6912 TaxID=211165 RepID=A0A433N426_CHLFR|nr:hypothetical protein [Chlorogloeopsis fritschii]RUR75992.1 hypothetical protein PCC6912_45640 [Chlorogloeopsis fritschii PCC 6912]
MQSSSLKLTIVDVAASFGRKPGYITGLDSATVALQSLGSYLKGKDFPSGGMAPSVKTFAAEVGSHLAKSISQGLSTWGGWINASPQKVVDQVRAETMSHWVISQYPRQQQYPAVMIGSSNGAAVHLGAALGIPWLPQTLLFCFQHAADPDDPRSVLESSRELARRLLNNNPDLAIYQMHDPNQDRIKVPRVGYFRLKRLRLGKAYKQFLTENLAPGATIFLLESQNTWLATRVQERHLFQFGGKGGLTPQEYFQDSQKIRDFLKQNKSNHQRWNPPDPDGWFPESEWGFDPTLRQDVEDFAREHNFRVCHIVFDYPQDLSFLVADLYRWWYEQRGLPSNRLFVESFVYLQPWWTLRLGLVPYWIVFNDQTSADRLSNYLDGTKPFDEIYLTLFSNGIRSLGLASIEQWRSLLNRAHKHGQFLGVNEQTYPNDLASFIRHYTDMKNLDGRYPMPKALSLEQLDTFLTQAGRRYPVQWVRKN